MKILITTGIYPPKIGGPAQYAFELKKRFEKLGHRVCVKTYEWEEKMPTGIRHIFFFFKILKYVFSSDVVFALDTFSVGAPTVFASKLVHRKCIIRTGGDFLWEQYVERTKKKVLLRDFYESEKPFFSFKENIIFKITKWTLQNVSHLIFSTDWQRGIFVKAYDINIKNTSIAENHYGQKESDIEWTDKKFVGSTRDLVWKNIDILKSIFQGFAQTEPNLSIFINNLPYNQFMKVMSSSYAVILVSLGDISPNMIMDAIKYNRPFICTKEVGIYERIKDAGIFVDPLNKEEIYNAISYLLTDEGYKVAKEKVRRFSFVHSWEDIANKFLSIANKIK